MKLRFNNFDIQVAVKELQSLIGRRLNQVYDVDNKTFLLRLFERDSKTTLLIESGIRFHSTTFEWPKNNSPSGFTMKLRKHLKNKRLEKLEQIGSDRIVNFVFGTDEYACNLILELYDRGNIILTDHENTILYILRPHIEGEDLRLVIREKYPETRGSLKSCNVSESEVKEMLELETNKYDNIKGMLMCNIDCGPAVIDHALRLYGLENCYLSDKGPLKSSKKNRKQKNLGNESKHRIFNPDEDFPNLMKSIQEIVRLTNETVTTDKFEGYIFQKKEEKPSNNKDNVEYFYHNIEFHPYLFEQFKNMHFVKFASFMAAVDEFYSSLEAQKIDLKTLQLEKEALKKLSNVKLDHEKRLDNLAKAQEVDKYKADLITTNLDLVDAAISGVRQLVANQMPWSEINLAIRAAQERGDPIASVITRLKLESNIITLALPSQSNDDENDENDVSFTNSTTAVDIDISNSAWANARKYYDQKKFSAQKEQKTIDASGKALKNAEKKTQQTLRDVRTISNIAKARKTFWFEKFYWFISSENYLVIGGRDAQQNELIVKRYMRASDIYVHAEVQGASSVIIRNPSGSDVPPKTLLEAGTMAISYSVAWDAKVLTNAYWVRSDQVSKTAPTGEYLGTGSFMIRGKKNFLPPCQLIMGVSVLFKLEDGHVSKHAGERKVVKVNEDTTESSNVVSMDKTPKNLIIDKKGVSNEEKDSDEKEMIDFPDTEVKVSHDTGCVTVLNKINESKEDDFNKIAVESAAVSNDAEETTIVGSLPQKVKTQIRKAKKNQKEAKKAQKNPEQKSESITETAMKRGKRNKERRKNKYKDQDFEERDLRMQILKSSGNNGSLEEDMTNNAANEQDLDPETRNKLNRKKLNEMRVDQNLEEMKLSADVDMLDTLTGTPFEDDELLFVIPVIAPYQALQHYKYKVKIIPGTGKRGTAAKTALSIFSQDKTSSSREKDLFKSIQNEVLARNIPGKVKLMAPQLQKFK